ncbi:MAG: HEAT repeat domain-containing protein [Pseudorhodoplanes sp.]
MPLIRKTTPAAVAPVDADRLAADLASASEEARWSAAREVYALPQGLDLLVTALKQETVPRVREALFTGLARMATPDSAAAALPYLRSDDAALRTGALDALRAMPNIAAGHLPSLLCDRDADVRLLACEIARVITAPEANLLLGQVLATEPTANVCAGAIEVLAEIGDASVVPALDACAARFPDDPFLDFAIGAARARIGSR